MNERREYSEAEINYKSEDSRRSFLKKLGVIGLGAAATIMGIEKTKEYGEKRAKETIQGLIDGPKKDIIVKKGDTLWGIYSRSGYTDIPADYYIEALKRLNPELKTEQLQENSKVVAPWKSAESTE